MKDKEYNMMLTVFTSSLGLITILVIGSYTYTWSESKSIEEKNNEWRKEHQQVLDKKFDELKQSQKELAQKIEQSSDRTQELLKLIESEIKKQNGYNHRR